jgi:hypothetical protein
MRNLRVALLLLALSVPAVSGCGDDDPGIYDVCQAPSDCVVPKGTTAACLPGGFCTWLCTADAECSGSHDGFLCASFESTADQYCFPPCEGGDSCPAGFSCRSTGGGSNNRKVCFPG